VRIQNQAESQFFGKLDLKGGLFAMNEKRFSVEQIVAVLKQAELGMRVADLIREVGISEQTFYRWKKHNDQGSSEGPKQ
jgi:transposase-like protein